jgi:hypothetical protein
MALEIEDGTIKQTVYLQNCSGKASRTVLQVKSKVNSIMIDGCSKTSLVVHRFLRHALCCLFFHIDRYLTPQIQCAGVYRSRELEKS